MAWRDSHSIGECCRECHENGGDFEACHDVCPTFQKARAERQEWLDAVRKNKEKEWEIRGYKRLSVNRTKKIVANKNRK